MAKLNGKQISELALKFITESPGGILYTELYK
jgi:hypothetical protein